MGIEIERKFLVDTDLLDPHNYDSDMITQGYFDTEGMTSVRIRTTSEEAFITIKAGISSTTRSEYEYAIPLSDGQEMLDLFCGQTLDKRRYYIPCGDHVWDVDYFYDDLKPLVVAEIELIHEDEKFEMPPWATVEITDDTRYLNCNLIKGEIP